jgi:hypothetical protein
VIRTTTASARSCARAAASRSGRSGHNPPLPVTAGVRATAPSPPHRPNAPAERHGVADGGLSGPRSSWGPERSSAGRIRWSLPSLTRPVRHLHRPTARHFTHGAGVRRGLAARKNRYPPTCRVRYRSDHPRAVTNRSAPRQTREPTVRHRAVVAVSQPQYEVILVSSDARRRPRGRRRSV